MWVIGYVTLLRLEQVFTTCLDHNVFVRSFLFFCRAKTSSSEDNLTVNRLVMIISYELLYIIN